MTGIYIEIVQVYFHSVTQYFIKIKIISVTIFIH